MPQARQDQKAYSSGDSPPERRHSGSSSAAIRRAMISPTSSGLSHWE